MLAKKLDFCLRATAGCLEKAKVLKPEAEPLLKFARDYYNDALYYEQKDKATALEAVAYAHGFIDAAVLLGLIDIKGYHLRREK